MNKRKYWLLLIGFFSTLVVNSNAQTQETWVEYETLEDSIYSWLGYNEIIEKYKKDSDSTLKILADRLDDFVENFNHCGTLKSLEIAEKKCQRYFRNYCFISDVLEQEILNINKKISSLVQSLIKRNIPIWKQDYNLTAIIYDDNIYVINSNYIQFFVLQKTDLHLNLYQTLIDNLFEKIKKEHETSINFFKKQDLFSSEAFKINQETNIQIK